MASFELAREKVRRWEGGWSAGFTGSGETYRGLDRNYNASWPGWKIIDKIPNKKQGQIFNIPALEALVEDYHLNKYWKPSRAGEILNNELATFYFDFYFHKPLQAVVAAGIAAKEINPQTSTNDKSLTNDVIAVMNNNPIQVYERMYQLRELHYLNKWMNKVGKNTYIYQKSQKGLLNRLYSFAKKIGTAAQPVEKKKPFDGRFWFDINGYGGSNDSITF